MPHDLLHAAMPTVYTERGFRARETTTKSLQFLPGKVQTGKVGLTTDRPTDRRREVV